MVRPVIAILGVVFVLALVTPGARATPAVTGSGMPAPAADRFTAEPVKRSIDGSGGAGAGAASAGPSVPRIIGSLALVAGLIVGLGFAYRRLFAAQNRAGGAVTVISRQMLTPKHQVLVLRVGRRLLIVGDSGQGMQALAQVTDPSEMSEIIGEATNVSLRADAFAATLDEVDSQYGQGVDEDRAPEASAERSDLGLGMARTEVQSLLAKVRQLAGQQG